MALRVESRAHVVLEKWMVSELGLKGDKLIIYAIIYGCSLAGNQEFTASVMYFCEWLDLTKAQVLSILRELEREKLVLRKSKEVGGIIYNSYRAVIPVPEEPEVHTGVEGIMPKPEEPTGEGDAAAAEAEEDIPYTEIIEYLNKRMGTSFKASSENTRKHIRARWRDGFRLEDFLTEIEGCIQAWKHSPKMSPYLRPQTLFGTKFESYLQVAKRNGITPVKPGGGSDDDTLTDIEY